MYSNIKWANKELPGLSHDDLNKLTENILSKKENGLLAATQINKNQGKKNAKSGHMNTIQKLGCSIGGIVSGNKKTKEQMKQISKLGNQANAEKYGVRIYATNLNTEEVWEYISIREAERDLKIQAPIIRKILRGLQPKTRCGWTFEYKNID
jgi:hypothetical protein